MIARPDTNLSAMFVTHRIAIALASLAVLALVAIRAADTPDLEERIAQHRNLGKAFYENPTTHAEAVAEFRKALDLAPNSAREKLNYALALLREGKDDQAVALLLDVQKQEPGLPHTWFNLGITYKKMGDDAKALAQFEHLATLAPDEPIVHYQLGTLYKFAGKTAQALASFERAVQLDPRLAAARFQLYNMYRQVGRTEDAARTQEAFQTLKKQTAGAAIPEDADWCALAEIYDPPRNSSPLPPTTDADYQERTLEGAFDPGSAALTPIDSTGAGEIDLLAWSSQGVRLYRHGVSRVVDAGLASLSGVVSVATGDFDNDGLMDLCVLTESGPVLYRNARGRFVKANATLPQRRFDRAVWLDYDHDYDLDLVLLGAAPALMRNEGSAGFSDRTADFPFEKGAVTGAMKLRFVPDTKAFDLAVSFSAHAPVIYRDQLGGRYTAEPYSGTVPAETEVRADFDGDGHPDIARFTPDGKLHFLRNRGSASNHWIRIQLTGVKNLKLAQDAEVEIKAGSLYRKQLYAGVPLVLDTGSAATVDTVRITWPNGLIQNEISQAANRAYTYKEAQRLSGSCPMIWTWNGRSVQFITDVLGVAPLGASDGEGTYFPVDHDEFVSIPGRALAATGGLYDIRVTEELSEVSYLDQAQLFAVDHPAGTEIFTNEKFKSPPYPESRLFGVTRRIYPKSARDDAGRDILPRISAKDQTYPDSFSRTELGVARTHMIELDFAGSAPTGRAVLLLNGWVDWPDGSTFRAASQELKGGLVMPYLQMQDAQGRWVTVNEDMGMPAGKPKTIAVDLRFPAAGRKIRIVTSLCVYWDEIFLSEMTAPPEAIQRPVPLQSAELRFRGFSESRIDPARKQPDTFLYDHVSSTSYWNPTPGMYTRYGDVRALIADVDDRLVIMGSGDEMALKFQASALPPLPVGWTRDFLLKVDGWAKDRDPNTAFSSTVEPLPFHSMTVYPYPPPQRFPSDAAHLQYREAYNTRPALRLIRPLR